MDKIPKYGTHEWKIHQYKRRLEEQRGHNYQWFNQEKWNQLELSGWKMHKFDNKVDRDATSYEEGAKEVVEQYRKTGHWARILCGYSKNQQRVKMFTVIYKKKVKNRYKDKQV